MTLYSVHPRDQIFVKGYGILSFAKSMGRNIGKNISKSLSGKYSQKFLDHAKQYATDALKTTSKKVIQKTAKSTGDSIGNKIANSLRKSQEDHCRIIQKQLKMNIIKKCLKKDIISGRKTEIYWWSKVNIIV